MRAPTEQTILGIDVGSSKVAILMAHLSATGGLTLLGGAQVPAKGLHRGAVANIGATAISIADALELADTWHGAVADTIVLSLNGKHLHGQNLRGMTGVLATDGRVAYADLAHAIGAARATMRLGAHEEVVHLLPRTYLLDGQDGIRDPLGMSGLELAVEAHAVTGMAATVENLVRAARKAHVVPDDLVAAPIAAAEAIRGRFGDSPSLVVAELGAETIGMVLLDDGAICHSQVLPVGSAGIAREVALALRLPLDVADAVICAYGCCDAPHQLADDDLIDLRPLTRVDEVLPARLLARIVRARAIDLAEALRPPIVEALRAGLRPAALITTGGGAELTGLDRLLMETLGLPVYLGVPTGIRGLPATLERPSFAVAAGLVRWGARHARRRDDAPVEREPARRVARALTGAHRWLGGRRRAHPSQA